jgi:hypothetical protein
VHQLEYFRSHAPRCTSAFRTVATDLLGIAWDGHGEETNTVFSVGCHCGSDSFEIHGYKWPNADCDDMDFLLSPIELKCRRCALKAVLFDEDKHGYDAALSHGWSIVHAEGKPAAFSCQKCGGIAFHPFIRFEYPADLFGRRFNNFQGGK